MPPALFSKDMEIQLMTIYEEVWVRASGSTLRSAEKYALVAEKNEPRRKKGRMEGGDTWKCRNKNGYPSEEGQKTIYWSFRKATRTGAPVDEGHFSLHHNKKVQQVNSRYNIISGT